MNSKASVQRDPLRIGIVGTVVLVALLAVGFNFQAIPGVQTGAAYHAEFRDASGLLEDSTVQMGGVEIGAVRSITLSGNKVDVEFDADVSQLHLGTDTTATIKVETVLGHRYIDLVPGSDREELHPGDTIPIEQTSSGYDITRSLDEVTDTVSKTDTVDLSGALDQISTVEHQLPPDLQAQLSGLTRLSNTVASRDQELRDLLGHAAAVTGVLGDRDAQVSALLDQGESLFAALNGRSAALHRILVQSRTITDELTALKRDNQDTLTPTLAQLDTLVGTLNTNYDNINAALTGVDRFAKQMSDVIGSGPFFGVLLHNILPANLAGQLPGSLGGPR